MEIYIAIGIGLFILFFAIKKYIYKKRSPMRAFTAFYKKYMDCEDDIPNEQMLGKIMISTVDGFFDGETEKLKDLVPYTILAFLEVYTFLNFFAINYLTYILHTEEKDKEKTKKIYYVLNYYGAISSEIKAMCKKHNIPFSLQIREIEYLQSKEKSFSLCFQHIYRVAQEVKHYNVEEEQLLKTKVTLLYGITAPALCESLDRFISLQ